MLKFLLKSFSITIRLKFEEGFIQPKLYWRLKLLNPK